MTVQCSTGFYVAVVKPSLNRLEDGTGVLISNATVTCVDKTSKPDQLGRVVQLVMRFQLEFESRTENVTLHLYHTQQKLLVQGKGTLWFVENTLKETFKNAAESNNYNIAELNQKFAAAARVNSGKTLNRESVATTKSCPHCNKSFRHNSKPVTCSYCNLCYHNTKINNCLAVHVCTPHGSLRGTRTTMLTTSQSGTSQSSVQTSPGQPLTLL